jgi:hypothetical protein
MTPEQVFLYRFGQLARIVDTRDMGALLDLSLVLRQLLVDGTTLVDAVNQKRRLKIRFTTSPAIEQMIAEFERRRIPLPNMVWAGDVMNGQKTQELNRDAFLGHSVLYLNGTYFSARQLIKACANRLGGVHLGDPSTDDPDEAAIRQLDSSFWIGGAPSMFRLLFSLAEITRKALGELHELVEAAAREV